MARISYRQLAKLFQRLGTSYSAGIDLLSIYDKETRIAGSTYRSKSSQIRDQLADGDSLTDAMTATEGYFPDLALAVVRAGEKSGRLEDSFLRLSTHYDNLVKFRTRFLNSIAWPAFELVASIGIIGLLILVMHWVMVDIGGIDPIDWFGMGSTTGNFLLYCVVVASFATIAFLLVFGSMKGWYGTLPMRIARRVPLLGKTLEHLSLSRFAWAMSASENAGMDVLEIGKLSLEATENYYYQMVIPEVLYDLRKGKSFAKTFRATDAFPEDFVTMIENGETAGKLAETMHQTSLDLQEKAEANLQIISKIGFVLMMGFVGIVLATAIILLYKKLVIDQYQNILDDFGLLVGSMIGWM
ncbi:type II secretion system F family protein [Mariniblastus fucicola]|uniref:Type II secretion system protein F n=1 Tax=Mariniblastus fucicola TaxID=980251 RepID=A0A5B9PD15_9BACT|nr:type II secretion system F family protein [Mariniblastus fucicola]QEG23065.1 Type II secretion system protein F [Mariniblastus fucicola]